MTTSYTCFYTIRGGRLAIQICTERCRMGKGRKSNCDFVACGPLSPAPRGNNVKGFEQGLITANKCPVLGAGGGLEFHVRRIGRYNFNILTTGGLER